MFSGISLMGCIKDIPSLKGDNYREWKKKIDLAFVLAKVDWAIFTPFSTKPVEPMRGTNEADVAWQTKERDYTNQRMLFDLEKKQWTNANKK
jgi:hypothetical protein